MAQQYGKSFFSLYGDKPTEGWYDAVGDLEPADLKRALDRMKADDQFDKFPPNAMQFFRLCQPGPEDMGLPSDEEAFQQSIGNRPDKHPAVIHTLRQIDSYSLRQAPADVARKLWDAAWRDTVRHVAKGGKLHGDSPALPAPIDDSECDSESPLLHAKAMKAAIRDIVGWKRNGEELPAYQRRMIEGAKKYFRDMYGAVLDNPQGRIRQECNLIIADLERGCAGYHSTPKELVEGRAALAKMMEKAS